MSSLFLKIPVLFEEPTGLLQAAKAYSDISAI